MYPLQSPGSARSGVSCLGSVDLFFRCASDRNDSSAWTEFLYRYAGKIRYFIRGTLQQDLGPAGTLRAGIHEGDLFQSTIMHLVENNCTIMKKFSGASESDLLGYLAVISRSVVRNHLRKHMALKRQVVTSELPDGSGTSREDRVERTILAHEIVALTEQIIRSLSGEMSGRDLLVFELHFLHGLSHKQIADCKGINLSKAGVSKLLDRVVNRVRAVASPDTHKIVA